MKIEHIGIWVKDLEQMKNFFVKYFSMKSGEKYTNPKKKFSSYFLTFRNSDARIELMTKTDIIHSARSRSNIYGYAHIAIGVGSKIKVNELTNVLKRDGFKIIDEPRTTGDGYYESVVEDPEGNLIEITL